MKFPATIALAAICLFSISPQAQAQFDVGGGFINAGIDGAVMQGVVNQVENESRKETREEPARPKLSPQQIRSILAYEPSAARTRRNLQTFVEKMRKVDPAGAAQLAQLFASTDLIKDIEKALRPKGLSVTNVADSFAVWWINAWEASRGIFSTTPQTKVEAVQRQAALALVTTPAFVKASDEQKQELAEIYLVQAVLIEMAVDQARQDPDTLSKVQAAIRQGARASGLDLEKMVLSDNGFVPVPD